MSFGHSGGNSGGRTRMGTKVLLNVYDLSTANDCLYPMGFGLHHSGVEIMGVEYSFASGAGIFESSPKEAAGAKFRQSIELGAFDGGSSELRMAMSDLRSEFGPDSYNILTKNCNHFAAALVWTLLRRPIPSYVNRLAYLGSFFSCLIPNKVLGNAPVGGSNYALGDAVKVSGGGGRSLSTKTVFTGTGSRLGGTSTSSMSSSSESQSSSSSIYKLVTGKTRSVTPSPNHNEDLIDRREKARMAAIARLEKNSNENTNKNV